jgi:hypothetical protein
MFVNAYVYSVSKKPSLIRTIVLIIVTSAAVSLSSQRSVVGAAITPEERAMLKPIHGLFDGMAKHDKSLIAAQMMPGGTATLYRNGQFIQMTLSELVDRLDKIITGPDKFDERIHDPVIRIDDNVAEAWAPYEALKNGKVDHCGTNVFILVHHDGRWLIASLADTFRRDCPTH